MSDSLTIILPHQLFRDHPSLDRSRRVVLIEDTLFFGDPSASPGKFHRQKIVLHRASMKAYESWLVSEGYQVDYIDYVREKPLGKVLADCYQSQKFEEIHWVNPVDFFASKRMGLFAEEYGVEVIENSSPGFLTPDDWAEEFFAGKRRPIMASFYEAQRKRMNLLVDSSGNPVGGRWSFDADNRRSMPKRGLDVPADPSATSRPETIEAIQYVEERFADYPGGLDSFIYPVTHKDADTWLERFFEERLEEFGPYEDALATHERVLFHSLLTPMLNIGLLTPGEVVDRLMTFVEGRSVPLNSLEGFLRQVIGWREFMRLMYQRHGVEMRNSNFFQHQSPLPTGAWDGSTGVEPFDLVVKGMLETGYAHHIERLMVLGNFLLLCRTKPDEVYDWFMTLFIDAYDWVMVPNVYGMSQFADGGIFTTKPYFSGSNYLLKMSDYAKGEWCALWDGLFWAFVERHIDFFRSQHRLGMMVRNLEKMDPDKRSTHLENAARFLGD